MTSGEAYAPNWFDLAVLWMRTHWSDCVCVVFFEPLGHEAQLRSHFDRRQRLHLIHASLAVLRVGDLVEATRVCNATPRQLYTMVWLHDRFVHENT